MSNTSSRSAPAETREEPVLSVDPRVQRFRMYRGDAEADVRDALLACRDTSMVSIDSVHQLLLNRQGLAGGMRYTHTALSQLCRVLAPNLSNVIFNVSGARPRNKEEEHSVAQAIDLLNRIIHFRFHLLHRRYNLILDKTTQQIEGVVGPRYHFFPNLEMYQRVSTFLQQLPQPPAAAAVSGSDPDL